MKQQVTLPEIDELFYIADEHPDLFKIVKLNEVIYQNKIYPIFGLIIGSENKKDPTLGLFGGVHGLERIGTQVILSYLSSISQRLKWDQDLRHNLTNRRIVCIPIINPWGIKNLHRCNHNGVDLMRNAPIEAQNATFLVGGQTNSN